MKQYFNSLGIRERDTILYEMGMKEKEHEKYFFWGNKSSFNNIDLDKKYPVENSEGYCKK